MLKVIVLLFDALKNWRSEMSLVNNAAGTSGLPSRVCGFQVGRDPCCGFLDFVMSVYDYAEN